MRTLRWGLLGTARINRAVIGPLKKSKRNQLAGVASRQAANAEAYAKEWDIHRAFGSYEAMLDDPGIDVVYISLPNSLHAEWTIRAARAGKHVLCEKPLALSVEEVDAMIQAGRENGVTIAEAFMYRHTPQTLRVQDIVRSNELGEIWLIRGTFAFNLTRKSDVRLEPELGGGCLWDVGCYPVSYARMLLGREPVEVEGFQKLGPTGVDLAFTGQMRFEGETIAQVDSAFYGAARRVVEIHGSQGSLTIPNPFIPRSGEVVIFRQGEREEVLRIPESDPYLDEIEDLANVILDGGMPRVTLGDSRANVAALTALYASARSGHPVKIGAG